MHLAIIGRIPFADDDTVMSFDGLTEEEARRAFADALYEDEPEGSRDSNIRIHGGDLGVFINHVLVSETPIREFESES